MRDRPYTCMICGQVEPLYYDPDLDMEYYSDDPKHDTLDFWIQRIEFVTGAINLRTCGECSKLDTELMLERYQARVRSGEIPYFN